MRILRQVQAFALAASVTVAGGLSAVAADSSVDSTAGEIKSTEVKPATASASDAVPAKENESKSTRAKAVDTKSSSEKPLASTKEIKHKQKVTVKTSPPGKKSLGTKDDEQNRNTVGAFAKQASALKAAGSRSAGVKSVEPDTASTAITASAGVKSSSSNPVTRFAFKLLSVTEQTKSNTVLCPISAYLALSMAFDGATGGTADSLARALQLTAADRSSLDERNKQITTSLTQIKDVQIANALYADHSASFLPSYLDLNKKYYNSHVENLNFSDAKSISQMNDWVSKQTQGKIPHMIDRLSPESKLVLLNATYFKGTWVHKFDKTLTKDASFSSLSGAKRSVPTMHTKDKFLYADNSTYELVKLPYNGSKLAMFVILPAKDQDFKKFTSDFSADTFETATRHMNSTDVTLSMPRFKVTTTFDLKPPLSKLGMGTAFSSEEASFSKMTKSPVFISAVVQKSFMEVDEEGTTAAAATEVEFHSKGLDYGRSDSASMTVDRPFMVALKDDTTGSLIFLGSVIQP